MVKTRWEEVVVPLVAVFLLLSLIVGVVWATVYDYRKTSWVSQCIVTHPQIVQAEPYCKALWYTTGRNGGR